MRLDLEFGQGRLDTATPEMAHYRLTSGSYPALEELHLQRFASLSAPEFPKLDHLELYECIVDPSTMTNIGSLGRFRLKSCFLEKTTRSEIGNRWPVASFSG